MCSVSFEAIRKEVSTFRKSLNNVKKNLLTCCYLFFLKLLLSTNSSFWFSEKEAWLGPRSQGRRGWRKSPLRRGSIGGGGKLKCGISLFQFLLKSCLRIFTMFRWQFLCMIRCSHLQTLSHSGTYMLNYRPNPFFVDFYVLFLFNSLDVETHLINRRK